jgi:adenylate kinase
MVKKNQFDKVYASFYRSPMHHHPIIIFYGPPGSGKGTQANLLSQTTHIPFFDAGYAFRTFAQIYQEQPSDERAARSKRMDEALKNGNPILTEDYLYIVGETIRNAIKTNVSLIMDKPGGSLVPEAEWMNDFINEHQFPVLFFHLPISVEESIKRVEQRWYAPKSGEPFGSKAEAQAHCSSGEEPYQRADDMSEEAIRRRYHKLYAAHKDVILDIFSQNQYVTLCTLNAEQDLHILQQQIILTVQKHITL